jgi:hypothetical protein
MLAKERGFSVQKFNKGPDVAGKVKVRPYSHGTTQKKLKGYASHQTIAWETPRM